MMTDMVHLVSCEITLGIKITSHLLLLRKMTPTRYSAQEISYYLVPNIVITHQCRVQLLQVLQSIPTYHI